MECSEAGCENPLVARGLCMNHYMQARSRDTSRSCSVAGCARSFYSRGLCEKHYRLALKADGPFPGGESREDRRAMDHDDGTRTCRRCGERKELTDFYTSPTGTLGRMAERRLCSMARSRRGREKRRDHAGG